MFSQIAKKIFGSRNERILRGMHRTVQHINHLESEYQALSEDELRAKTFLFRARYQAGETLEQLLPEAFAAVREAACRTLGLRHFDVQLIGGMVLHQGKIAEMRTGEGKTLVATLPAYLNAMANEGVHIITVNDYLAARDADWMRPVYGFLGLTVGVVIPNQPQALKKEAYHADITYGTNNEFGFDYLRDNMAFNLEDRVQRSLKYAIVDEVDSILIDEARTPLIISGAAEESSELYRRVNQVIPLLVKQKTEEAGDGDFTCDEKMRQTFLTERGHQRIEELLLEAGLLHAHESLYDAAHISLMHHVHAALRAHTLFHRDVDYIVKDGQIMIVDEHTGRTLEGRRWSEGLHQAMEAKEGVTIQQENQTLASITFQNYFRLYEKLAGMTGTADTEAYEFNHIYGLEVVVIPTNKVSCREDHTDQVYLTVNDKFNAIIKDIKIACEKNQPVLVGTISIENSEKLAALLQKEGIAHQILNAKFHRQEAQIVAEAGRPRAVTIATNMAGRGTDIVLGGNLELELKSLDPELATPEKIAEIKTAWHQRHETVLAAGGLYVIGSERHESRRVDNQLRGRCGRQGDPGQTRFYLSLQDDLMRIFASDRVAMIMQRLGMKEEEAIEHPWVTKAIENAQRKVEGRNFDIRKELLEFDDVANDQRKVIYKQRYAVMTAENLSNAINELRKDVLNTLIDSYIPPQSLEEQWDIVGLEQRLLNDFNLKFELKKKLDEDPAFHEEYLRQWILDELAERYAAKQKELGDILRQVEKSIMLQNLDIHWREHLALMDYLRQGIHLRGYAAKNPKQEYKREAFELFSQMLESLKFAIVSTLSKIEIKAENSVETLEQQRLSSMAQHLEFQHPDLLTAMPADHLLTSESVNAPLQEPEDHKKQPSVRATPKVGRNDPCFCNSGKKYKYCHGSLEVER